MGGGCVEPGITESADTRCADMGDNLTAWTIGLIQCKVVSPAHLNLEAFIGGRELPHYQMIDCG